MRKGPRSQGKRGAEPAWAGGPSCFRIGWNWEEFQAWEGDVSEGGKCVAWSRGQENLLFLKPQNSLTKGPGVCIGGVVGCWGEGGYEGRVMECPSQSCPSFPLGSGEGGSGGSGDLQEQAGRFPGFPLVYPWLPEEGVDSSGAWPPSLS